jgi:hypothetical protein
VVPTVASARAAAYAPGVGVAGGNRGLRMQVRQTDEDRRRIANYDYAGNTSMFGFMRLYCGRGGYAIGPISSISSELEFRLGMGPSRATCGGKPES